MSKAQEERVTLFINWGAKIVLMVACFLMSTIFIEIRNDIRQLNTDVSAIKERIAKIEGMINK